MPALDIIVCAHRLAVNTPIFGRERGVLDPLMVDVTDQVLEGLGLSLTTEELEHCTGRRHRRLRKLLEVPALEPLTKDIP